MTNVIEFDKLLSMLEIIILLLTTLLFEPESKHTLYRDRIDCFSAISGISTIKIMQGEERKKEQNLQTSPKLTLSLVPY